MPVTDLRAPGHDTWHDASCPRCSRHLSSLPCRSASSPAQTAPRDKKIEFVYLALGASDAAGVGAVPLTEGYVFLIKSELDRRIPGVALLNLGVPGARIDLIKEQVRVAAQIRTRADLATLWTGGNDIVHGDDPVRFQEDLRFIVKALKDGLAKTIVIANLPDLTKLPRFQRQPDPNVTAARVAAFNRAIESEARLPASPSSICLPSPFVRTWSSISMDSTRTTQAIERSRDCS